MKLLKIIGWIIFAVFIMFVIYFAYVLYILYNTPLLLAEDYTTVYVEQSDIVDADIMRNPPEKYRNLLSLDAELREEVAKYMEKNKLKLKGGKQHFRINYSNELCRKLARDKNPVNALIEGEWIAGEKHSGFEFEKINE